MEHSLFRCVIQCPVTHKPIPLKLTMDREQFLHATFRNIRTSCPHCRQSHTWQKTDVTLTPAAEAS
jgi:hypothetical protein